jgi:hypothetical protein
MLLLLLLLLLLQLLLLLLMLLLPMTQSVYHTHRMATATSRRNFNGCQRTLCEPKVHPDTWLPHTKIEGTALNESQTQRASFTSEAYELSDCHCIHGLQEPEYYSEL